jgi:hypothetical protein
MPINVTRYLAKFNSNPAATSAIISDVVNRDGLDLPSDYLKFMEEINGGEGFVGSNYLILWRIEELAKMNIDYQVQEYAPGLFLFGSDGGGEAFAFDLRSPSAPIISVPFVGLDTSLARPYALNFTEFLERLYRS